MTVAAPTEFEFRLPVGWEPAGASEGTFVALNVATADSGFTANITAAGLLRPSHSSLDEIAEESVTQLREATPDLVVISRGELGDPAVAAFGQQLRMTASVNNTSWDVIQAEVYISKPEGDGSGQAVVRAVLTATVDQFASTVDDFDDFLATLRFVTGD
jgi:hypothetical protein